MKVKKIQKKKFKKKQEAKNHNHEIKGIVILGFGVLIFLSLYINDSIGIFGNIIKDFMLGMIGVPGFIIPPLVILYGFLVIFKKDSNILNTKTIYSGILIVIISSLIQTGFYKVEEFENMSPFSAMGKFYIDGYSLKGGGFIGGIISIPFLIVFQSLGTIIILTTAAIIDIMLLTNISIASFFISIKDNILGMFGNARNSMRNSSESRRKASIKRREEEEELLVPEIVMNGKKLEDSNLVFLDKKRPSIKQKENSLKTGDREISETIKSERSGNELVDINPDKAEEISAEGRKGIFSWFGKKNTDASFKGQNIENNNPKSAEVGFKDNDATIDEDYIIDTNNIHGLSGTNNKGPLKASVKDNSKQDLNLEGFFQDEDIDLFGEFKNDTVNAGYTQNEDQKVDLIVKDIKKSVANAVSIDKIASSLDMEIQSKQKVILEYKYPHIGLLDDNKDGNGNAVHLRSAALKGAKKLEETLKSFGVDARVINVSMGPAVTRYEIQPSPGVKVSKIVGLSDDISLNLAASGVRIEAPIPGKAAIGIEVPNKEVVAVFLKDVIDSENFKGFPSKLAFALGKDISGQSMVADIGKMPHVLVAGATGSGKSVCINSIIVSLLFKASPDEVKLLMIDPKVVELGIYNGIPHLLIPVVTDPKKAAGALNWAVQEMVNRYKLFAQKGVRDIKGYNEMVKKKNEDMKRINEERGFEGINIIDGISGNNSKNIANNTINIMQRSNNIGTNISGENNVSDVNNESVGINNIKNIGHDDLNTGIRSNNGDMQQNNSAFGNDGIRQNSNTGLNGMNEGGAFVENQIEEPLPQIVIIIDELADLMMVAPNDVEDAVCRLAQMARAAGMHLVIATQRPSVDVITGVIKANIPSRIAFAVSSQVDSRTIIDMAGAEKLLGRGDMLFYPVGEPKPIRVKGAFVSDKEVERVVEYVKSQGNAEYNENIIEKINSGKEQEESDPGDNDELLPQAIEIVVEAGQASVSLIQRKFKVGYARAARIVDQMEARGIVGGFEGSKPRQVLITRHQLQEMNMKSQ